MKEAYIKALIHAMYYIYVRFNNSSEIEAYNAFSCLQVLRAQLADYVGVNKAYLFFRHVEHLAAMKKWNFYKHDVSLLHVNINLKQQMLED